MPVTLAEINNMIGKFLPVAKDSNAKITKITEGAPKNPPISSKIDNPKRIELVDDK